MTLGGAPAFAQTRAAPDDSVAALRAEADATASRYIAALTRSRQLDHEVAESERLVATLEANARAVRDAAAARAVAAYRQSSSRLAAVVESSDILAASRRVRLVNEVNRRDHESYARLRRAAADLRLQRKTLDARRTEHAAALAELHEQAIAVDAKLAVAQRLAAAETARAAAAALAAPGGTSAAPSTSIGAPALTGPSPMTSAPEASKPAPPAGYAGTPGTHPRHDDPFLTCVRQRESGGNYGAVSRAGYLGAYQFAQSTWNASANHAGRPELVGVPANLATPYDQDDVAWSLYQWQGTGPWGGACP